jgi:4-diphosphocytidyl-2-C-methyl-D-erythritol kinase
VNELRALAPGKVNLCLFLGPSRADGYHELVSLIDSVDLADELRLGPASDGGDEVVCPAVIRRIWGRRAAGSSVGRISWA